MSATTAAASFERFDWENPTIAVLLLLSLACALVSARLQREQRTATRPKSSTC
ncbi:hypothetical protein [Streptomyces sp. NBC_01176]|uniref:hypothetical protein n=1 Tax=Streptomyces sp. NBC_01176 TaxID=2903760 RepID=UPI00386BDADB|nr:hypothetical protein OG199_06125 [Streptomyces sp. NBC_01176]